jgi:hypothetical protein
VPEVKLFNEIVDEGKTLKTKSQICCNQMRVILKRHSEVVKQEKMGIF